MRRLLLGVLLLMLLPPSAVAQPVAVTGGPVAQIIGPDKTAVGSAVWLETIGSVGNTFRWEVVPETEGFRSLAVVVDANSDGVPDVDDKGKVIIHNLGFFSSRVPGTYTFLLIAVAEDAVAVARHSLDYGGQPDPDPDPDPDPPPPPPPPGVSIIIVEESTERTAQQFTVYMALEAYLDRQKIQWLKGDQDWMKPNEKVPEWFKIPKAAAVKAGLPALVVCSKDFATVVDAKPLPSTVKEAIELVKQYEVQP